MMTTMAALLGGIPLRSAQASVRKFAARSASLWWVVSC